MFVGCEDKQLFFDILLQHHETSKSKIVISFCFSKVSDIGFHSTQQIVHCRMQLEDFNKSKQEI